MHSTFLQHLLSINLVFHACRHCILHTSLPFFLVTLLSMVNIINLEDYDSETDNEYRYSKRVEEEQIPSLPAPTPPQNEDCHSTVIWQSPPPTTANDFEASSSNASWSNIESSFIAMGFSSALVQKAIKAHGTRNKEDILEYLLTCKVVNAPSESSDEVSEANINHSEYDENNNFGKCIIENAEYADSDCYPKEADHIKASLLEMGYSSDEVCSAVDINGADTPIHELVDFIEAKLRGDEASESDNIADEDENNFVKLEREEDTYDYDIMQKFMEKGAAALEEPGSSKIRKRKQLEKDLNILSVGSLEEKKIAVPSSLKRTLKNGKPKVETELISIDYEQLMQSDTFFKGFLGFGIPGSPPGMRPKELKPFMKGPPFFYFENVAFAPKEVWSTIARHFDGIDPEFVDSKHFSASKRPRGYVHNLPIEGRFQALPLPPMTVREALPETQKYWPLWDDREKLNCICTGRGSDVLCQELRGIMNRTNGKPPIADQAKILEACKKWNFVWVGPNQMAPLEPHEIELLLGYERDHTRGASSRTDRLGCLGNAFQTDTVAYHLSVLKPIYSDGIKVLSLFSGIGGAEVSLHRLGIPLNLVVAVEICPKNRLILSSWWKKTNQKGILIEKEDVRHLTRDILEDLVDTVGGFDLIIGGSPCNNISGNNRVSRDGLDGTQSSVFYEFPRILNEVRQIMRVKGLT